MRRTGRKIYEIYDSLLFSGLGQQSDIEALRTGAIDFAHQEGYQRSEEDVTIQRVVNALSQPMKRAFGDFNYAPVVARGLFAEVGRTVEKDQFFLLDFDGDYTIRQEFGILTGNPDSIDGIRDGMKALVGSKLTPEAVAAKLQQLWATLVDGNSAVSKNLVPEAAVLLRDPDAERKFRLLNLPA
jgi:proteasome alpha subunit